MQAMPAVTPSLDQPRLPAAPSLKHELIARGVPGASMFPDDEVESYAIDGSNLEVTFKRDFEIPLDQGIKIMIAKQVSARLIEGGLMQLHGVSASKKVLFANVQAKILGIKVTEDRLIISTDNSLLPQITLDAAKLLDCAAR